MEFIDHFEYYYRNLAANIKKKILLLQLSCINFVTMGIVRKTKSVNLLLAVFQESEKALSVVQLVESMRDQMNKTTVYRILDRLEQGGMVHSFFGKDGLKWYAKCSECSVHHHSDEHPHFQCSDCGTIECLSVDINIPTIPNLQISSAEIMLTGTCSNCSS